MSIFELNIDSLPTMDDAIRLLKEHKPTFGCFSGGKDSVAIKEIARIAGINVEWHYHKTTIDPPELVKFIKKYHSDVIFDRPKYGNFFNRMIERGVFPTRRVRARRRGEGKYSDG